MLHFIRHALTAALACGGPLAALAADAPMHATPQTALEALMDALASGSDEAAIAVLGPESETLVRGETAGREDDWALIHEAYLEGYRFVPLGEGRVGFELGKDDWPFPIELVASDQGWSFDIESGREEIVARQIGLNELDIIESLNAYVGIQQEFRLSDHDGDGVMEFAASLISSESGRDGLYWPGGDSPVGDSAARASLDGYGEDGTDSVAEPFFGYYFRLLPAQGPDAPGGAMSYTVNGNMVAGHALLAVPAVYGETGIHSFVVAENGRVFEADLGAQSLDRALETTVYNPGDEWAEVE